MNTVLPQLFVFDLDGVITDTAKYHYLAWKRLANELNFSFNEKNNELLKGVSRIRSFEIILEINNAENIYTLSQKEELANKKNEYYQEYIQTITNEDLLPGIKDIIGAAKANGIKCAVASISKNARPILEKLNIVDMFDYIADAEKVKNPKPDPEIFLTCAEALSIDPTKCVAFEDAQAGIEAINSAKMMSVGIGVGITSISPDIVLKSTREIDFKMIVDFYSKWKIT